MATTRADATDLALAQAFAHGYCAADPTALRDVVAPDVRVRVISPPGY